MKTLHEYGKLVGGLYLVFLALWFGYEGFVFGIVVGVVLRSCGFFTKEGKP